MLEKYLTATSDARMSDNPKIRETYPRRAPSRELPPSP